MQKRPRKASRVFHGCLGAMAGAAVAYGIASSGPLPPDWRDPRLWLWVGGLAVVCGAIGAADPVNFWRPKGGWPRQ